MKPGMYEMSMEQYQADPCPTASLSSGAANRIITQSPLHAWFAHPKLNPNYVSDENGKFDKGTCAHAMLLGGEEIIAPIDPRDYPGKRGGIPDGWTNDAIRGARDAARANGKIPILIDDAVECLAMAREARKAIATLKDIKIDLSSGLAERVLVWQERGTWCRARPDWMSADRSIMIDYKSTAGSAEPNAWARLMVSMGYDLQSAHYKRGNAATGGKRDPLWLFLVQENYPPYACSFVGLDPAMQDIAEHKWDYAIVLWSACLKSNKWGGYPVEIAYAEPNAWHLADDEERLARVEELIETGAQA